MDDKRFWDLIESAWDAVGGMKKTRQNLAERKLSEERAEELMQALDDVIPALQANLDQLSAEELLAFDRVLERKLYDIDRADVHEHTDGSDDGFLYARLHRGRREAILRSGQCSALDRIDGPRL